MSEQINPDLYPLFQPSEDLMHPKENVLGPLFSVLYSTNERIPPWIEPNFWSNLLNREFFVRYLQEIFKNLTNMSSSDPNFNENMKRYLATIFHLVFSFHFGFLKDSVKIYYDKLLQLNRADISQALMYLEKHTLPFDMATLINRLVIKANLFVECVVPIFTFHALLHILRNSVPGNPNCDFQNLFLDKLIEWIKTFDKQKENASILFLHLIHVLLVFCPDADHNKLNELKTNLEKLLAIPSPVSDLAFDTINFIGKSIEYSGYCFYKKLINVASISECFSGQIPLFFDGGKTPLISTFLYNDCPDRSSFLSAYATFPRYFIIKNGFIPPANISDLYKFMQTLSFSKKFMAIMEKAFNLQRYDKIQDNQIPKLTLPQYQYQVFRLTTQFSNSLSMTTRVRDRLALITSPLEAMLNSTFFTPLLNYFNARNTDITEQPIVIIGTDYLLSIVVSTLISFALKNRSLLDVEFQFFYVPVGNSIIAHYISFYDQIYETFVSHLFTTINSILPGYDENSKAFFPSFVPSPDLARTYENSIFFSLPSPSHIFQHGLQHYLHFANKKTDIFVMQCIAILDKEWVSIPFINKLEIEITDVKRTFIATISDYKKQDPTTETISDVRTISFYNIPKSNPRANPDYFIFDTGISRLVQTVTLSPGPRMPPFNIVVDGMKYGPVPQVKVMFLTESPDKLTDPMRIKIRTFVDIY